MVLFSFKFLSFLRGLKQSYEDLLRRKAAMGQDMVFAEETGMPRVVPAKEIPEGIRKRETLLFRDLREIQQHINRQHLLPSVSFVRGLSNGKAGGQGTAEGVN